MNTAGHEAVGRDAGLPLLAAAFGENAPGLDALLLGNWLTDVSQAVDPVAYWSASQSGKGAVDAIAQQIKASFGELVSDLLKSTFIFDNDGAKRRLLAPADEAIEAIKQSLLDKIDFLLAVQKDERSSRLAGVFRSAFLVVGYFKFVHPQRTGLPPRMDKDAFFATFGEHMKALGAKGDQPAPDRPGAFTQYYPHEHLDRAEMLPPENPPLFAPGRQTPKKPFRVAAGKLAGTRAPSGRRRLDPDLYSYLRDDIEMTAGLLAEVDLFFRDHAKAGVNGHDKGWYATLAKLGHALHQVEDFFAHSNWIELVAKSRGAAFLEKTIPRGPLAFFDRQQTLFTRRLTRHLTESAGVAKPAAEPEDWVVTGYFDLQDTLISLAHLSEELLGLDVDDPFNRAHKFTAATKEAAEEPKTVQHKLQKLLRDTLDLASDPAAAFNDRSNDVAKSLREKFESELTKLTRPRVSDDVKQQILEALSRQVVRENTLLARAPSEIQRAFLDAVVDGSRVYTFGSASISLYTMIRELADFFGNPLRWLLRWAPEKLREEVKDAALYYGKELFYERVGAARIGCHSLLAKDHVSELFYEQQKACATAVHWYIVKTLLRWRTAEQPQPIDWVELLEYFPRNPMHEREVNAATAIIPVTIGHVVAPGEQLDSTDATKSLTKKFGRTALDPGKFTWRTIADANFGTAGLPDAQAQVVVNDILNKLGGIPVTPPNYAFRPGMLVLIPNQKLRLRLPLASGSANEPWYVPVIDKGWKVFPGYEDEQSGTSVGPLHHHTPIPLSLDQQRRIVARGKTLRRQARESYRIPT